MSRITIVSVPEGDWEGLYVDGVLKDEGHRIRFYDLISMPEIFPIHEIKEFEFEEFDEDKGLPENLNEVLITGKNIYLGRSGGWFELIIRPNF